MSREAKPTVKQSCAAHLRDLRRRAERPREAIPERDDGRPTRLAPAPAFSGCSSSAGW